MITRHIEFRQEQDGVISGTVLRYGDTAHIGRSFHERFLPGSVHYDDVVLNLLHDRQQPVSRIGAGLELSDNPDGLTLRSILPNTVHGRHAKELIDANIIRGLSAEFISQDESYDRGMRVIKKAELLGVALVDRPAYPSSLLDVRSAWFGGHVRLRQGGISGFIPFGVAGVVSLMQKRKLLVRPNSLTLDPTGLFLLNGYNYDHSLASTIGGSLAIKLTKRGIDFGTRRLESTDDVKNVRKRIRGGLINGAVPGIGVKEAKRYTDDEDFEVTEVLDGVLCHINLTAREGLAAGGLGGRRRRRRWLY